MNSRRKKRKLKQRFVICSMVISALVFVFCMLLLLNNEKESEMDHIDASEFEHSIPVIAEAGAAEEEEQKEEEYKVSKVIVVDAGHGGYDVGCSYDDVLESSLNLSIALKVRDKLKELGYEVIMVREEDKTVPIKQRSGLISGYTADLFVSIHQNIIENDSVTNGIETWYRTDFNASSEVLAGFVQQELIKQTGARDRGLKLDTRSLAVLKSSAMPACLIETGFLSCEKDREQLVTGEYQEKIAQGITDGIVRYLEEGL